MDGRGRRPHTNFHDSFLPPSLQRDLHSREIRAVAARDDFAVRDGRPIRALRDSLLLPGGTGRAHGGGWEGTDPAVGRESGVSGALGGFDTGEVSRAE